MISQVQRSAVSVSSNIAYGLARVSSNDQAHFYAYACLMELLCQLTLRLDIDYMKENAYDSLSLTIDKVAVRFNALQKPAINKVLRQCFPA